MTETAAPKISLDRPVADFYSPKAVTLPDHFTVDESLAFLRANPTDAPVIYFYVLDPARKLVGVLPARRLLLAPGVTPIRTLMTTSLVTVRSTDTLFDAMELFAMHRLLALPVLDRAGGFMGILDYSLYTEEVFDLAENRQLNEVFQLIGVRYSQAQHGHPFRGFKLRMPWLLCNIAGGLACAVIGSIFEHTLAKVVVLSLFIPIVLTLAESVAVQSMTLAIESAGARASSATRLKGIFREIATALLLGVTAGLLVAGVSLFWRQGAYVPLIIGSAIAATMVLASLLGRIVPGMIYRLKLNPTVASGPVTLAFVDVVTVTVYLSAGTAAM
jgi:magnesium transporter